MTTVLDERSSLLPLTRACSTLGLNRSTVYAHQQRAANDEPPKRCRQNSAQPNALTADERETVVRTLNGERFTDQSPKEVYQRLLESGQYLCSVSTMYRFGSAAKAENDVNKGPHSTMQYRGWWQQGHTKCGLGISLNSRSLAVAFTCRCTSYWIYSAVTSSRGWCHIKKIAP